MRRVPAAVDLDDDGWDVDPDNGDDDPDADDDGNDPDAELPVGIFQQLRGVVVAMPRYLLEWPNQFVMGLHHDDGAGRCWACGRRTAWPCEHWERAADRLMTPSK